jgi:hypothetical protein
VVIDKSGTPSLAWCCKTLIRFEACYGEKCRNTKELGVKSAIWVQTCKNCLCDCNHVLRYICVKGLQGKHD